MECSQYPRLAQRAVAGTMILWLRARRLTPRMERALLQQQLTEEIR